MNLDAYRRGRLGEAEAEAARLVRLADEHAREDLDEARRGADARVEAARREATAEGERAAADETSRERRRARGIVLGARRDAYLHLVAEARDAARALRRDPGYASIEDRLERAARRQLGATATVVRDPDPDGGVVASADGRRVDYTLPTLALRGVEALGATVERLWR